jgi:TPR repeat protein
MIWKLLGIATVVVIVIFTMNWRDRRPVAAPSTTFVNPPIPTDVEVARPQPEVASREIASPSDELIVQAAQGDVHAQARACVISMASGDATLAYGEAARWCALAAAAGNSEAQTLYARQYQLGLGIAQDNQLAIEWYEKAAAQQNAQAMYMLGQLLTQSGTPADEARGIAMLQRAAALGNVNARWSFQKLGVAPAPRRGQEMLTSPSP